MWGHVALGNVNAEARVLSASGLRLLHLHRTAVGPLELRDTACGHARSCGCTEGWAVFPRPNGSVFLWGCPFFAFVLGVGLQDTCTFGVDGRASFPQSEQEGTRLEVLKLEGCPHGNDAVLRGQTVLLYCGPLVLHKQDRVSALRPRATEAPCAGRSCGACAGSAGSSEAKCRETGCPKHAHCRICSSLSPHQSCLGPSRYLAFLCLGCLITRGERLNGDAFVRTTKVHTTRFSSAVQGV